MPRLSVDSPISGGARGNSSSKVSILTITILVLSIGMAQGREYLDNTRLGPQAEDVLSAFTLDLIESLGPHVAATFDLSWVRDSSSGRVFAGWDQNISGYPVRGGVGRSLAIQDPETGIWRVCYRAFKFTHHDSSAIPTTSAETALKAMRETLPGRDWTPPVLELAPGKDGDSILCWSSDGISRIPGHHSSVRVDVDARSGRIVSAEERVCQVDIPGTVEVIRTDGTLPQGTAPVTNFPLQGAQVTGDGVTTWSAEDGSFLLTTNNQDFTVQAGLVGQWGNVISNISPAVVATAGSDTGGTQLILNDPPETADTAQANAFHYMGEAMRFYTDSPGGFPAMVTPVNATTGLTGSCNAFYDPAQTRLMFLQAGGGCVDSAYSSVVLHEFGHHVVSSLGLVQQAFGEGYGDSLSVVYLGEGVVGRNFSGPGLHVRNVETAGVVVPCNGGIHFCGQALGGFWFDLRETLVSQYGATAASTMLRSLFVDWSSITLGGSSGQAFHYNMVLEILAADDVDGNILNGTPNYQAICDAAQLRGILCPELITLNLTLQSGPGESTAPSSALPVSVFVEEVLATPLPGASLVFYRFPGLPYQTFALTETSPGVYEGNFPPLECYDNLEWFVSVQDTAGQTTTLPPDAVSAPYSTVVVNEMAVVLDETMATNPGWSVSQPGDTATAGFWAWGDPFSSPAQPSGGVPSPNGDILCYITGLGGIGQSQGAHDVDGGTTTLTSTEYSIDSTALHRVKYWRWFSNATSITSPDDSLFVYYSVNGGSNWILNEEIGPGHPHALGGWYESSFWVQPGVSSTSSVMLRFVTGDAGSGNVVEAGVDSIQIQRMLCASAPPPVDNDFLRGDCNVDGNRDLSDAVQMLDVLFGSSNTFPCEDACDENDSGQVDLGDVIQILQELFMGLPGSNAVCGPDPSADSIGCEQATTCP